jgi:NTE family protein
MRSLSRFKSELLTQLSDYYETVEATFKSKINGLLGRDADTPDIIDTVMASINIMQERITRINLAVEPPDVLVQPRLGALKMMDFDQVELAIEEGHIGMKEKMEDIKMPYIEETVTSRNISQRRNDRKGN